ncbi:MAG: hypothetical protein ACFFCQ_01930, partial [Promethearchaeota archaeon]
MDWEKKLRKEAEITVLEVVEKTLNKDVPIFDKQIKWNDFGVYINNKNICGLGFYSQKLSFIPRELWSLEYLEV